MYKKVVGLALAITLFVLAGRFYMGYRYYDKYRAVRKEARSIQGNFLEMENCLLKAIRFSANPAFYEELGRLNLERALAENDFGTAEKRDAYLDKSLATLGTLLRRNPGNAAACYEMGKAYLLYNYPLLTYQEKSRLLFRKTLELKPADEFFNLNIIYTFFVQWDSLQEAEKTFALKQLRRMETNDPKFLNKLGARWQEGGGSQEKLERLLRGSAVSDKKDRMAFRINIPDIRRDFE